MTTEEVVRFEAGPSADLADPDCSVGLMMFGAEWPRIVADHLANPNLGGTAVVTSIDREAGTITVGAPPYLAFGDYEFRAGRPPWSKNKHRRERKRMNPKRGRWRR